MNTWITMVLGIVASIFSVSSFAMTDMPTKIDSNPAWWAENSRAAVIAENLSEAHRHDFKAAIALTHAEQQLLHKARKNSHEFDSIVENNVFENFEQSLAAELMGRARIFARMVGLVDHFPKQAFAEQPISLKTVVEVGQSISAPLVIETRKIFQAFSIAINDIQRNTATHSS